MPNPDRIGDPRSWAPRRFVQRFVRQPLLGQRRFLAASIVACLAVLAALLQVPVPGQVTGAPGSAHSADPGLPRDLTCVEEIQLERGQAPSTALLAAGFSPDEAGELLKALGTLVDLRRVRPSDCFRIFRREDGRLARLDYQREPKSRVVVDCAAAAMVVREETLPVEIRLRRVAGDVQGNLYESLLAAGGTPALVVEYSDLFAWSFDFLTDTRNGDRFDLLVEEEWLDGTRIGTGRVLAGRYQPVGEERPMDAYWFTAEGYPEGGYFQASGESVRRQFLKSPLNFRRISSHFSHSRMHPIFKTPRPHLGVDYAAAAGTPVVALGSGKVSYAGWIKGFGNTVKIKHNGSYLTQYAHLSRFAKGIRQGSRIGQGDVIGYVGSTGYSTGPHLDFRVQENGRWVNPLSLKGGRAEPIPSALRATFVARVAELDHAYAALAPGSWFRLDGPGALASLAAPGSSPAAALDTPGGS